MKIHFWGTQDQSRYLEFKIYKDLTLDWVCDSYLPCVPDQKDDFKYNISVKCFSSNIENSLGDFENVLGKCQVDVDVILKKVTEVESARVLMSLHSFMLKAEEVSHLKMSLISDGLLIEYHHSFVIRITIDRMTGLIKGFLEIGDHDCDFTVFESRVNRSYKEFISGILFIQYEYILDVTKNLAINMGLFPIKDPRFSNLCTHFFDEY